MLARIDPAIYEQEVNFARAQLNKAKAKLKQTEAQTVEASTAVERAIADQNIIQWKVVALKHDGVPLVFARDSSASFNRT